MRSHKLSNLLDTIDDNINGHKEVTMADIIGALERRGFGPLLVMPALVTILPTGAIPGLPAVCGALICLISCQIIAGRRRPWLPKKLQDLSMDRKNLEQALEKAMPIAEAIDDIAHPRYEMLTRDAWQIAIALTCILLGIVMAVIGFIPYLPALMALPVLLFAIGLTVRDGLLTGLGFLVAAIVLGSLPFLYSALR